MRTFAARLAPLFVVACFASTSSAQQSQPLPNLAPGDAVVTGFSGTLPPPKTLPRQKSAADATFIDPDGASLRVFDASRPGFVWDARLFDAPTKFVARARDIGQVFGVALDDATPPNIYVAATSMFGLNLVSRGRDGRPERRKVGGPGAGWMQGQFGLDLQGGPGAIYKIDGRTGTPTLFANVTLDSVPNPAAGLGNLAYDAEHKQLFASDLFTGMIHRFDLTGKDLGNFDHGIAGLTAAKLPSVAFDPRTRPNIAASRFDSEKPDTWGFAPAARRVWGVAVHDGRLYYSVLSGPQVWSVGITRDGGFSDDPRWELDVPAQAGALPVTDIAFSHGGAMILAQRAPVAGAYDYSSFTRPAEPQVLRFRLKGPEDPPSPGRWYPTPAEYPVGFAGNFRNSNGGVALGYGYDQSGVVNTNACESSVWATGQNLRNNPGMRRELEPGGPLVVHGVQASPIDMVRRGNEPPSATYFVDYDNKFEDPRATGHLGSVRIYTTPCPAGAYAALPLVIPVAVGGGGGGNVCTQTCVCPPGTEQKGKECVKRCVEPQLYDPASNSCKCPPGEVLRNGKCVHVDVPRGDVKCTPPMVTNESGTGCICPQGQVLIGGACVTKNACTPPLVLDAKTQHCVCPAGTVLEGRKCVPTNQACPAPMVPGPCTCPEGTVLDGRICVKPTPIDLKIEKTGGTTPACPVGAYAFTIKVTNAGAGWPGSGSIVVSDTVPANMTFAPIVSPPWSCLPGGALSGGTSFQCTYNGPAPTANQTLPPISITASTSFGPPFPPFTNCASVISTNGRYADSNASNNNSCTTVSKPGSCGCPSGQVLNAAGICSCPDGQTMVGGACVPGGNGTFGVRKVVTSNVYNAQVSGLTFPITVTCDGNPSTFNLPDGGSQSISNLPIGSSCTVQEAPLPPLTSGSCAIAGDVPTWTTTYSPSNTATIGSTPVTVTVNNNLECKPGTGTGDGTLIVTKKVINNTGATLPPMTFPVGVYCSYGQSLPLPINLTLTDGVPQTVNGVIAGSVCSVNEQSPPVPANVCPARFVAAWTTSYSPSTVTIGSTPGAIEVDNTLDCRPVQLITSPPNVCPPPKTPGDKPGSCVCPAGTEEKGDTCAPSTCPSGTTMVKGACVAACTPPQVRNDNGVCACPAPMKSGAVPGQCLCAAPNVMVDGACVVRKTDKKTDKRKTDHKQAQCPEGTHRAGKRCVKNESNQPRIRTEDVIRGIGGFGGFGGGGGGGGGRGGPTGGGGGGGGRGGGKP